MMTTSATAQLATSSIAQFLPRPALSSSIFHQHPTEKMDMEENFVDKRKCGFNYNYTNGVYQQERKSDYSLDCYNYSEATELINDECILIGSKTICLLLAKHLPSLFSVIQETSGKSSEILCFSEAGNAMLDKICHFFKFSKQYAELTTSEMIHSIALIYRLCQAEERRMAEGHRSVISEANLGTLLLCAVVIAQKTDRDIPFKNSWWSRMFGIPLNILNQSETVFLTKIDFFVNMEESNYWSMHSLLISHKEH